MLCVETDPLLLQSILAGYESDPFCTKLMNNIGSTPGLTIRNRLLYVGNRLVIPRVGSLREDLFRLTHNNLGHFDFDKSYASLRNAYYWPNMRQDLEEAYIPTCVDCQRNKSHTKKPSGLLHPLPIPDARRDSIAINFISHLPIDNGFDCIVTITDRLGADVYIAPTHVDITAEHFAAQLFDLWYCENSLPLNIISDRDKIFVSKFWKALHALTGVKLKMSSAYHPETDGSSEHSNKTVAQALRYHVDHNQKNWVKALPVVRFNIMNTVNASTSFSPFQLCMGHLPRLIPPLILSKALEVAESSPEGENATSLIESHAQATTEAQDNLLAAKVNQADATNQHRGAEDHFNVEDKVLLSMEHRRHKYVQAKSGCVAKFMPRFDGPFTITHAHPETSNYTLELPNEPNRFPTFHSLLLRRFFPNNNELFKSHRLARLGPVLTPEGHEEWLIRDIIDERVHGRGMQYLV
jgi:hypothetical protein